MPAGSRDRNPRNPFQSGRLLGQTSALGLFLLLLAALPRIALLERHGLWPDEVFSLALATGHSLEHPAAEARRELGDWVEPQRPVTSSALHRFLEHERPPAGPPRVLRAVFLSDTSPPLYYLLLSFWTRALGTSDAALRGFSVFWSLAALPLLWALARDVGGRPAALCACVLYALAPVSLYYSTEGRMYSLAWFLAVLLAWTTLRLARQGGRLGLLALWVLTGAAGMLTHYFFAFVLGGCLLWILLWPGELRRSRLRSQLIGAAALTGLAVLPWMVRVPDSLSRWRISAGWLDGLPPWPWNVLSPMKVAWSYFSGRGHWGNPPWTEWPSLGAFALLAAAFLVLRDRSRPIDAKRAGLFLFWAAAACLGPLVFDFVFETHTGTVLRYGLAGMPAALLLAGIALGALRPGLRAVLLSAILIGWLPGAWDIYKSPYRALHPLRQVGRGLAAGARPGDLVMIHSIPSGVLGVARYMDKETEVVSWVQQLGVRRVPEDLEALLAGHRRVVLLKIHLLGEEVPEEAWLRENATLLADKKRHTEELLYFAPPDGLAAFPSRR